MTATGVKSKSAGKKAYLVNPPDSLGMKSNRLNVYLGDNGAFEVDAHFDTTNIETAYRRFVDFFLQAANDIPALNGYDHFPPAEKLIQNVNGWENELGDQIFFQEANDCLCVDINEDFIYIFGKFNQHSNAPVAEPQLETLSGIGTRREIINKPLLPLTVREAVFSFNQTSAGGEIKVESLFKAGVALSRIIIGFVSEFVKGFVLQRLSDKWFGVDDGRRFQFDRLIC